MKKIISFWLITAIMFSCGSFGCYAYSAKCSVLINGDTGEILYSVNADKKVPMASTTKIMTALLLCEKETDLEKTFTVPKEAVLTEGTSMGLKAGDTVSFKALLYGMLLSSGNDAANTVAYALSGSIESFALLMNKRAADMGLKNTNFVTPSGLDAENHYTTASDLAVITREALKNKTFSDACGTKSITLSYGNPPKEHTLTNHNRLLKEYGDIIGVKTGYTGSAGRCLVTAAKKDDKYLICVTLNDKNDWSDHRNMIDKGYSLLEENSRINPGKNAVVPLSYGGEITLSVPELKYYSENGYITVKTALPAILYPPLKAGDEIGTAYYFFERKCIKQIKFTALYDIKKEKASALKTIKNIINSVLCSV